MSNIKLVVLNEHTLGYIDPELPEYVCFLHSSILKGSPYGSASSHMLSKLDKVRLATENDFEEYRCQFSEHYKNDGAYEYQK